MPYYGSSRGRGRRFKCGRQALPDPSCTEPSVVELQSVHFSRPKGSNSLQHECCPACGSEYRDCGTFHTAMPSDDHTDLESGLLFSKTSTDPLTALSDKLVLKAKQNEKNAQLWVTIGVLVSALTRLNILAFLSAHRTALGHQIEMSILRVEAQAEALQPLRWIVLAAGVLVALNAFSLVIESRSHLRNLHRLEDA